MRVANAIDDDSHEPILIPVDRISELLFGLFMALSFVGAMSVAQSGREEIRSMFFAALGCNLAWGLVDAVMYLVRTITERGRTLTLVRSVQNALDRKTGDDILKRSLSRVAAGLVSTMEIEAIRGRIMALASLPKRPQLRGNDLLAALAIFLIIVASTFPVVLPFVIFDDVGLAKSVSRDVALVMLFFWWSRARSLRGLRELEGWFSDDRYRLRTSDGDSGARRIRSDGVWIAPSQNVRIRMKSTRTEY